MPRLQQTYINGKGVPKSIEWSLCTSSEDLAKVVNSIPASSSQASPIGLSIHVNEKGAMEFVAVSTGEKVAVLKANMRENQSLKMLLAGNFGRLVGFDIVRLAMHIKHAFGHHVHGSHLPPKGSSSPSGPPSPGSAVRGLFTSSAASFDIDHLWDFDVEEARNENKMLEYLCLRAWISQRLAAHKSWANMISTYKLARTSYLSDLEFKHIFVMIRELDLIDMAKSRTVRNDFTRIQHTKKGNIIIHNERYSNRVRQSDKTRVVFKDRNGKEHVSRPLGVSGKQTTVLKTTIKSAAHIKQVTVEGREELTHAERARDKFLLQILSGESKLSDSLLPFIDYIWFPARRKINLKRINNAKLNTGQGGCTLNPSQASVVEAMIHPSRPVVIVHGPPGTGKTTTISASMREICASGSTAWIVAQSNVGVKNIAESLCKYGVDFKLLVSKEFHFEWHEHIYVGVENHVIRTDELPEDPGRLFRGTRVVLCTLSTLSNPKLGDTGLFRLVPMKTLVVDEASQIGILDYMHLFGQFKELKKCCFFGDPKQLPPYGKSEAPTLQSIFDLPHLKSSGYFLDTQYRMPCRLGDFISQAVYESKLKSVHPLAAWDCIRFVDVCNGEEEKAGKSWKNPREVQSIVHLVRYYYRHKEFCIITPYDAQRNAIQRRLKEERLPWENVFNVDSFQGNEAKYVLVSVVRTTGPGFLKSQNRVNVMLTRCKAGMIIVSNRSFMHHDSVRKTLLGKLALHWESKVGKSKAWCRWNEVAEKKAKLPGASALSR